MTALRPDQFDKLLAQHRHGIERKLADLGKAYRDAYGASLERVVRENAGKVMSGGASDPTATITGDPLDPQRPGIQAAIRRTLEAAPKSLTDAENTIASVEAKIAKAMDRLDPREGFEAMRYPISVSHADLEESRAAQERRMNGTGTG
jgi:hypothetical protein